jgi:hypothetical protein
LVIKTPSRLPFVLSPFTKFLESSRVIKKLKDCHYSELIDALSHLNWNAVFKPPQVKALITAMMTQERSFENISPFLKGVAHD